MGPDIMLAEIPRQADKYFLRTKEIIREHGDRQVTYVVFMRRPVVFTPKLGVYWLT